MIAEACIIVEICVALVVSRENEVNLSASAKGCDICSQL